MYREVGYLLIKDVRLELKQKNSISIILLYSLTSIFLVYMAFTDTIDFTTWNALFWVLSLFAATTAISKSFANESGSRHIYMYSITSPQSIIIGKIIFNAVFMILLSALNLVVFIIIFNKIPVKIFDFCLLTFIGITGLSVILTMVSAIANRTSNSFLLMTVLGFPLILPLLLSVIKATTATTTAEPVNILMYVAIIIFMITASLFLSVILFPFIWRE